MFGPYQGKIHRNNRTKETPSTTRGRVGASTL
jgi:hypothetical protein